MNHIIPKISSITLISGKLRQQDANEAWLSIIRYLQLLKGTHPTKDAISQLMGIGMKKTLKCVEEGGEDEASARIEHTEELNLSVSKKSAPKHTGTYRYRGDYKASKVAPIT